MSPFGTGCRYRADEPSESGGEPSSPPVEKSRKLNELKEFRIPSRESQRFTAESVGLAVNASHIWVSAIESE